MIAADERRWLEGWLSRPQAKLFAAMHPADQRHGLDVAQALRGQGLDQPALLLAALFHDAGKGRRVGLVSRVVWSLGERYGSWAWSLGSFLPGIGDALARIRMHEERSAILAQAAGCPRQTVELIRHQRAPRDPVLGTALRAADDNA